MLDLGAHSSLGQSTGLLSRSERAIAGKYASKSVFAGQQDPKVARSLVTDPGDSRRPAQVAG